MSELTEQERESLGEAVLDHTKDVLDYGTREACSCGEYRWTGNHATVDVLAAVERIVAAREAQVAERIAQAIEARMRGDEFEENAASAIGEGEWSWFRWEAARIAREAVS